uniref:Uncharacterized protein n=1 Tax=Oryza sativa subsp. japonica TaxID=39947 RepID=Q6Z4D4_ORYSJ|nr:hypothetical protein [Oryza sativa Japonica Group]
MEDSPEDGRWGSVAAAPGLGGGRRRSVETPIGQVSTGRVASCSVGVGDVAAAGSVATAAGLAREDDCGGGGLGGDDGELGEGG